MSKVLIVEDELSIAELEKDYLELSSFEVEIETDGQQGLEKALKNASVDYDLVGFSEIDKFAIKSYCAIHEVDESLKKYFTK